MFVAGLVVFATYAYAFAFNTGHSSLVALTVLFLALRSFAFASFEMSKLSQILNNFILKCFNIPFEDRFNSISPSFLVYRSVKIIPALCAEVFFALTSRTACGFVPQTFTIKFQALCIFALAAHTSCDSRLFIVNTLEKLFLRNCLRYYLLSFFPYFFFEYFILRFLILNRKASELLHIFLI
jgi:hypothetical protein